MTKNEEIKYLTDLLLQASRWERSEGEVLSGLELEVQDRLRNLLGQNTVDENGRCQSEPVQTPKKHSSEAKRRWQAEHYAGKTRVKMPSGRISWVPFEHVEKTPIPNGAKFKWTIKPEFASLYKDS